MLILDKQKAVEHMVALTAGEGIVAQPEGRMTRPKGRTYHRVAQYERRIAAEGSPPPRRSPFGMHRRLAADGPSPV